MDLDQALEFSRRGDQAFAAIADRLDAPERRRLAAEHRIACTQFALLRAAMGEYLAACFGCSPTSSEAELLERLLAGRDELPNYSPGALLAPKREQTFEFNVLHRRVADVFARLDLADLIDGIDLPINVRVVYGEVNRTDDQPYASTKLHSDVWAGVPADGVVIVIPVLGDIDNLTIEMGEMPRALERAWMRPLRSYDEGAGVAVETPYDDVALRHGHVYFADARLLHQTVRRRAAGVRVSIDFRFRMADERYRALAPPAERTGPDSGDIRVPYAQWLDVGRGSMIAFDETMDHARAHRAQVQTSVYGQRPRRVALFEAAP